MSLANNIAALIAAVKESETVVAVFHNHLGNCRYTLKNGKDCVFLNGQYTTRDEAEIEELLKEIAHGHPHINLQAENLTKETKYIDPMEAIRAQVIAELQAQGRLISEGSADYGTTAQAPLNAASTKDVAAASAGSSSGDAAPVSTAKIVAGPR